MTQVSKAETRWAEFARLHGPYYDPTLYTATHEAYVAGYLARPPRVKATWSEKHYNMICVAAASHGYLIERLSSRHFLIRSSVTNKTIWDIELNFIGALHKAEGLGKLYRVIHQSGQPTAVQVRDQFITTELT